MINIEHHSTKVSVILAFNESIFHFLSPSCRLVTNNWGSVSISSCRLRGVDRGALVGHLSNKTIYMISSVGGGLDTTVREGDGEGALDKSIGILGLGLLEVSLRVVISHSILIGKRL